MQKIEEKLYNPLLIHVHEMNLNTATVDDIAYIQELARKQHLLLNQASRDGFVFIVQSEAFLRKAITNGLSKIVKSGDKIVGYVLVVDENTHHQLYGRELGQVVTDDYHTQYQVDAVCIVQANIDYAWRGKFNIAKAQRNLTEELFDTGANSLYAVGSLNPFNPRTYYLLSEMCGWKRSGFKHERLQTIPIDLDIDQLDQLGGFTKLKAMYPEGLVFGLYSKLKQ